MRLYSFYQYGVTPYSLETRNFLLHFNLSSVIISIFKPQVLVGFYCLLSRQVFWPNFLWQIKASAVGISRAHAYITLNWRVVNYTNHSSRKKLHFFLFQGSRRQSLLCLLIVLWSNLVRNTTEAYFPDSISIYRLINVVITRPCSLISCRIPIYWLINKYSMFYSSACAIELHWFSEKRSTVNAL